MRLPRLRTLITPLVGAMATLSVLAPPAHAKDIPPVGAGDLLPAPGDPVPKGEGTLYEEYGDNIRLWMLDTDYGWKDFESTIHWIAELLMMLTLLVTRACIIVVQWMFELLTVPELSETITGAVSGASEGMMVTLMPAALAIGAIAAFAGNKQARGSQLGQLAWVALSAIFAISLLTSPKVWVDSIDGARQIGSEVALKAGSGGVGDGVEEFPFALDHETTYTDNDRDTMMRKSADAIWRTYGATPWCLAEFGSLEVCKDHGLGVLKTGSTDTKERKEKYLHENVSTPNVGADSVAYRQGKDPVSRIVISAIGLVTVLFFAALVVALAFASIASLIGALMLLVSGVFFACLWCIPGRARQWGIRWFDYLLGFTLQSAVAMLVLTTLLVIQASIAKLMGTYGWMVAAALMIVAAFAAFRFRKIMESIIGVTGAVGPGAAIAGLLAAKGATKAAGLLGKGLVKMHGPTLRRRGPRPGSGPGEAQLDRIPRPRGPMPQQLPGSNRPQLPPGGGPAGAGLPRNPTQPLPPGSATAPLPGGNQPAAIGRGTGRPELSPGQVAGGGRSVADGPPQQRGIPAAAGSRTSRQQAAAAADRPGLPPAGTPGPAARPSPTLRTGQTDPGAYTFRQGPRTGAAAPRVIRGQVISRTDRPMGRGPAPTGPGRAPRRPAPPAPTPRQRTRQ